MLVEFSVIPIGKAPITEVVSEVIKIIDESGLRYKTNPAGTCVEGSWDEIFPVLHKCHLKAKSYTGHNVVYIKVQEEDGKNNKLEENINEVEKFIGRKIS